MATTLFGVQVMVRVFVVDDSLFMRRLITGLLEEDPGIKVVGTARDGKEALSKLLGDVECDAVTMDVEMPVLNGLETLKQLMASKPLPVLMLSSLTEEGAETTLKALDYGALDFIPKSADKDRLLFGRELRQKVTSLANRKSFITLKFGRRNRLNASPSLTVKAPVPTAQSFSPTPCRGPRDIVVIGVSTGGPPVVQKIFSALPANLPACILVAQHMPASFTGPFAKRLDNLSAISVSEATDGAPYKRGHAYICPGGKHIGIRMRGALPEIAVTTEPRDALYKPTVNVLMGTAGEYVARRTLGVMLTGMGSDGIDGARILKDNGGCLIAQSENSCVVYGMSKAVVDANLANEILDADDIAQAIITTVKG